MKRGLALDIATKAGWSLLEGEMVNGQFPTLLERGLIVGKSPFEFGKYPKNYLKAASFQADQLLALTRAKQPDVVIIEQLNLGKSRNTQRLLDWTHAFYVFGALTDSDIKADIVYIDSSAWRKTIGLQMSKEDKKANAALSKAKKTAAETKTTLDKAALGVRGKVTKKHLAIRWANENYNLNLIVKDNDVADSIGLGVSYFWGASTCDGT